jgi:hypothetical protein
MKSSIITNIFRNVKNNSKKSKSIISLPRVASQVKEISQQMGKEVAQTGEQLGTLYY